MKKSYIAALLAGVMALSVVTSGCGDKEEKNKTSEKSVKDITHSISNTLEQAEKAMRGELEFAYNANANIEFGSAISDLAGVELKPVDITTNTKQKGKKTSADVSFNYDSKTLVSFNTVFDHSSETMFLKVPELSDAYLTGSKDDLVKLIEAQENSLAINENSMENSEIALSENVLKGLKNIDFNKLEDNMKSYVDLIKEKIPEPKEGDKISGEIDGHKYEYTTKSYEINGNDVKTIAAAVVDKAKTDTFIKDIAISMGATQEDYNSALDSALKSFTEDITGDVAEESVVINVYYNKDGEYRGWSSKDEDVVINIISINDDDVMAMDYTIKTDEMEMTIKGSAVEENDKANGEFNLIIDVKDTEDVTTAMKITLTDVVVKDDVFSGTITYDMTVEGEGAEQIDMTIVLKSNSTKDKMDISCAISVFEKDYVTISMTMEETDASDITIPEGMMYNITKEDDVQRYMSSCDILKFSDNLKSVLGEEIFNAFTQSGTDDYYYEDDDYYDMEINEDLDSESAA
ncbi:MAG: hypothetical protein K2F81_08780 [Ruminococcus sp.]|nr:hypothetical protein [Ruminococcus sp.]